MQYIVFRTNTSYNRWDEARKFWGLNINHTRDLNRMATAWYGDDSALNSKSETKQTTDIDPAERAYLLGQVSLFTWAFVRSMKRHLSPPDEDEEDYRAEMNAKLAPEQAAAIIAATHRPNRALYDLSVAIEKLPMHFLRKNAINNNLSIFEDTLGGSERLLSSPVPLFYSRHTSRFISVWLLFLPFALYSQFGDSWNHIMMIPATSVISLFLFGIEELATQLEEPFTILPMQGFCDKIGANCDEIVSWAGHDKFVMPTLEELAESEAAMKAEDEAEKKAEDEVAAAEAAQAATKAAKKKAEDEVAAAEVARAAADAKKAAEEAVVVAEAATRAEEEAAEAEAAMKAEIEPATAEAAKKEEAEIEAAAAAEAAKKEKAEIEAAAAAAAAEAAKKEEEAAAVELEVDDSKKRMAAAPAPQRKPQYGKSLRELVQGL